MFNLDRFGMSISLVAKDRVKAVGLIPFRLLIVPPFLVFYAVFWGIVRSVINIAKLVSKRVYIAPAIPIIIVPLIVKETIGAYATAFGEKVVVPIADSIFLCRSVPGRVRSIMKSVDGIFLSEKKIRDRLCSIVLNNPVEPEIVEELKEINASIEKCAEESRSLTLQNLKTKEFTFEMVNQLYKCYMKVSVCVMKCHIKLQNIEAIKNVALLKDALNHNSKVFFKLFDRNLNLLRTHVLGELKKIAEAPNKSSQMPNKSVDGVDALEKEAEFLDKNAGNGLKRECKKLHRGLNELEMRQALYNSFEAFAREQVEELAKAENKPALEMSGAFSATPAINSSEPAIEFD